MVGKRKSALTQLWLADYYQSYEALWFVWQADWRGRAYPVGTYLHPQTDDFGRSLLEFAEGKELGEDGLYYLTLHLGNCLGFDKEIRSDRYKLVFDARRSIEQWVQDPIKYQGWTRSDDPYMALAAARDWCNAVNSGRPEQYVSHLPCAIDGRCNGLQHFSAVGKDSVGGRSTNLLPSDKPNDIYSDVARVVLPAIENDRPDPIADSWSGRVNRKTVKRAVMTTPYGVTEAGMTKQFVEDGHCDDLEGNDYELANYLKVKVHAAVGEVVVKAREYMDWLQQVATIAYDMGQPIVWTTDCGLVVCQEYLKQDTKRIDTILQKINIKVPGRVRELRKTKQCHSISPNVIHSIDADHMYRIRLSLPEWVSFIPIHDSFASHACDMKLLNRVVREEFVKLHSVNRLELFKKEVESRLMTTLPPLPEQGDLDINLVLDSEFAFD